MLDHEIKNFSAVGLKAAYNINLENYMTDQKIKDYEVVFKKINHLKDIRIRYQNGNNLDVFLEEYGLSSSIASVAWILNAVSEDRAKISELLQTYAKYERQYVWNSVSYNEIYAGACKLLQDYDDFKRNLTQRIIDDEHNTLSKIMQKYDVDAETASNIYVANQKYEKDSKSILAEQKSNRLTLSQSTALQKDIINDYADVITKHVNNYHNQKKLQVWLKYLDYSYNDLVEAFLQLCYVERDEIDKQDNNLSHIINLHIPKFIAPIRKLQDGDSNVNQRLSELNNEHEQVFESFKIQYEQWRRERIEKQQKAKQFLLNMTKENKNIFESSDEDPVSNIKESLDGCYDKLNEIMETMHDVYESLETVPKSHRDPALEDVILMLMDMKKDYIESLYTEHSDLYTYLKLSKTIQLCVGRTRGITNAIHRLVKAEDIIVVPENHHKQQYAQLSCVVITPNELHLIPDHCPIGNIYIDYCKTMFDAEIKSIYEALGRNHKQFFILVG